jgi:hypothetical protein
VTYPCPKGCDSTDPVWCSECGAAMTPLAPGSTATSAAAAAAAPAPDICPDCGSARHDPSARFCEVCRYDFEAGQSFALAEQPGSPPAAAPPTVLPEPIAPQPTAPKASPAASPVAVGAPVAPTRRWDALIDVDPDLAPEWPAGQAIKPQRIFPLELPENLIGRRSDSMNIHPEIPIDDDPGVSRRHARIFFTPDGVPALLELGSANGTSHNGQPVESGLPIPLADGDQLTLGRWTRITIKGR